MRTLAVCIAMAPLHLAADGFSSPALITIRGVNVDSTIQEIETVLGECRKDTEFEGSFLCGKEYSSSYRIDDNGKITHINFPCQSINVCEYSDTELADLLSKNLSLSEPRFIILGNEMLGLMMDGPAKDRLFVMLIGDYPIVSIGAYNYRKPSPNSE